MLIESLNWRHAVKAYDPNKKVTQQNIDKIVEAARLAPTSSGLQPFQLIVISNNETRNQLISGALNPECMRDCSHVLVFAAWDNYTAERIDKVYDFTTDERGLPRGRFENYTKKLKEIYLNQSEAENHHHISKQTYIALGLALAQAAELKIDSTPIEGFDTNLVDKVLDLQNLGLKALA